MASNDFEIGALYVPGGLPGYFSQPGGVGTEVLPVQVQASSDYLSIKPFTEYSGVYIFGCQHSANECMVFRDVDVNDGVPVALLCCPLCSYLQRIIKPYDDALMGNAGALLNSILYP